MYRLSRRSVNSLFNYGAHRRRAVAVAAVSVYSLHVNQTVGEKNSDVRWKPGRMIPTWNRWYESTASTNVFDPVHKYEYQPEVSRLMDLIANSVYSNKEVFLRELISNASDALDKLRLLSVTEPQLLEGGPDLDIRIQIDQHNGIITLTDSGIGMTHDELVDSLGTIVAHTGTAKFLEALKDSKDAGQFGGVGFYSAFLVADKVVVSTKSPKSDKQYVWEGEANNSRSYIIREETDPDKFILRGTSIKLHLKRDDKGFANPDIIQRLINNHSQVVSFPIYTWQEKGYTKEVEVDDDQAEVDVELKKKTKKKIVEKYWDWELITNEIQPIWLRNPKEVTRAEYNELYKKAFSDYLEPLASSHFTTKEDVEFSSILYVPAIIPMKEEEIVDDIKTKNIRLYVKHVFISSDFDTELFPGYLSFVKGVIDSNDLPSNVSREILQDSPIVRIMRKQLVHKAFDMILLLSTGANREDYEKFWDNFGKHLKLGCIEDHENHYRLAPLLRFFSSHSNNMISLDEYVENMQPDQKDIFYVAADNVESAMVNPVMERLWDKDLQVLFLVDDPIDEFAVRELKSYKGKNFVDISKEDFILGDDKNEEKEKEMKQEFGELCIWMKKILGDKVDDVQVSRRLTKSPCVIVSGLMKGQTVGDSSNLDSMSSSSRRRVLEINPEHGIIHALIAAFKTKKYYNKDALSTIHDLYAISMITCGFTTAIPTLELYKKCLGIYNEEISTSWLNKWTMTQQNDDDDDDDDDHDDYASPFKHCIVVVETPEDENSPTADEIIFCYLHSLVKAIDRDDILKMKIFWVSTKGSCAYAYGGLVPENQRRLREEVYIDGKAVSYDAKKLYDEWLKMKDGPPRDFVQFRNIW